MSRPPAFVIPEGVIFEVTSHGVTIENRGDVVLHTDFGGVPLQVRSREGAVVLHTALSGGSVEAAGDVQIAGDAAATRIVAGGSVRVEGRARVDSIEAGLDLHVTGDFVGQTLVGGGAVHVGGSVQAALVRAGEVVLDGAIVHVRAIHAARSVRIGAAKLAVDAIVANEVHVERGTGGCVTIVECANELGPNALKGCFRVADYAETIGDPAAYLRERGIELGAPPVAVLAPSPAEPSAPVVVAPHVAAPHISVVPADETWHGGGLDISAIRRAALADTLSEGSTSAHPREKLVESLPVAPPPAPPPVVLPAEPPPPPPIVVAAPPEPEPEPVRAAVESAPPVDEAGAHMQLMSAAMRIVGAYSESEVPPGVNTLSDLVAMRDYATLKGSMNALWGDLNNFHRARGIPIHKAVTPAFNEINKLVRRLG